MTLQEALVLLVQLAAGIADYLVMNVIHWKETAPEWAKRAAAFGIAGALGALIYLAQVAMLYEPAPVDWRGWVEAIFYAIFVVFGASQLAHIKDLVEKAKKAANQGSTG